MARYTCLSFYCASFPPSPFLPSSLPSFLGCGVCARGLTGRNERGSEEDWKSGRTASERAGEGAQARADAAMELTFSCFVRSTPPPLVSSFSASHSEATAAKRGLFLTDSLTVRPKDRRTVSAYFCLLIVRPSVHVCKRRRRFLPPSRFVLRPAAKGATIKRRRRRRSELL